MPLIAAGFVLLLLIAVFAPYIIAIAVVLIIDDREVAAFFVSLIPLFLLIVSFVAVYGGFRDIRRQFKRPRRRLGLDNGVDEE